MEESNQDAGSEPPPVLNVPEAPIEAGSVNDQGHVNPTPDAATVSEDSVRETLEAPPEETGTEASDMTSETARAFAEARHRLQDAVESGLEGGRMLLDQFGGRDQLMGFGSGLARTPAQFAALSAKAMEAWQSNAGLMMAHWQSLLRVTSWSEMIALNAEHTRKQIEAMTAQAREFSAVAGNMAQDPGQPAAGEKRDGGF